MPLETREMWGGGGGGEREILAKVDFLPINNDSEK